MVLRDAAGNNWYLNKGRGRDVFVFMPGYEDTGWLDAPALRKWEAAFRAAAEKLEAMKVKA